MKKDRLVITISDIDSSKSFSVNKIIKKIILWTILAVLFVVSVSFFTISKLSTSVNTLSGERDKLTNENSTYSKQIESKPDDNFTRHLYADLLFLEGKKFLKQANIMKS